MRYHQLSPQDQFDQAHRIEETIRNLPPMTTELQEAINWLERYNLNDYEQVRTLISALREREWRPIESAPKDGTKLLVLHEDGSVENGVYWQKEGRCCMLGSRAGSMPPGWTSSEAGNLPIDPPTHWTRLPEPPASGEAEG